MLFLEGRQLLLAWLLTAVRHRGNVAALLGNSGQVFLAPGSPVFPTKHLGYLTGWVCQVHAMLLLPVKLSCSMWGENFTSLKDSYWSRRQDFMAAINVSYEVWELGGFFWRYQSPQKLFSPPLASGKCNNFLNPYLRSLYARKKNAVFFFPDIPVCHTLITTSFCRRIPVREKGKSESEVTLLGLTLVKTSASSYSHA